EEGGARPWQPDTMARPGVTRRPAGPRQGAAGPGTSGGGSRSERLAVAQMARPKAQAVKQPTVQRGVVCCRRSPATRGAIEAADRAIALRTDSARPRSRSGVAAMRYPFTTESVEGTARPTGTSPTASTTAWGQTRKTAQPNQAQTSSTRT